MLKNVWFRWSGCVLLCSFALAQEKAPLKVVIISGEGALNDIRKKEAHDAVVEIRDEYDKPVANARVVFQLPMNGAGGAFGDNQKELIATTDEHGRAATRGLKPNALEGRFPIRVTASIDGRQGSAMIWQSNTLAGGAEPGRSGSKLKYVILLLGAGGAVGAVAAMRGGGSSGGGGAAVPTTLSPGTVTVGGPR